MTRIRFEDLPSTDTPINATQLDKLNNVVISPTEPTTGEEVWIQKGKNLFNINGAYWSAYGYPTISENSITLPSSDGNIGGTRFTQKIKVDGSLVLSCVASGGGGYARPLLMPLDSAGNVVTDLTIDGYTYLDAYKGYYRDLPDGNYEQVLTFPETIDYFQLGFIHLPATFSNIQIERGDIATEYEPYVYKKIYTKNDNGVYEEFNNSIVESGSNSNGSYIKYADGTMEQRGRIEIAADVNYGNLVFPIPFVGNTDEIVMCVTNIYKGGNEYGGTASIYCCSSPQIYTLSSGYIYSLKADGSTPSFKRTVSYIAIGRWK